QRASATTTARTPAVFRLSNTGYDNCCRRSGKGKRWKAGGSLSVVGGQLYPARRQLTTDNFFHRHVHRERIASVNVVRETMETDGLPHGHRVVVGAAAWGDFFQPALGDGPGCPGAETE